MYISRAVHPSSRTMRCLPMGRVAPLDLLLHGQLPGLPPPICLPRWDGPAGLITLNLACHCLWLCLKIACQRWWTVSMVPQRWSCCHRVPSKMSQLTGGSWPESRLCPKAVEGCKGGTGHAPRGVLLSLRCMWNRDTSPVLSCMAELKGDAQVTCSHAAGRGTCSLPQDW